MTGMNVLSMDLRLRIVGAYERNEGTYAELAQRFGVGEATVSRLLRRQRERGHLQPEAPGGGFPPRIADDLLPELVRLVAENPDATLDVLVERWQKKFGGELSRSSLLRALERAGVTRKKNDSGRRSNSARMSARNEQRSAERSPRSRSRS
jgi:transposase